MKTIEYHTVDKSSWGQGPWVDEPDKKQWQDPATQLPCLIVRNSGGAWCGYVGVGEGHPLYEKDYEDAGVRVHGGLTFSGHCQEGCESDGICHVAEDDKVFWLGFDCSHAGDIMPAYNSLWKRAKLLIPSEVYRDQQYVTDQVTHLALQLKGLE